MRRIGLSRSTIYEWIHPSDTASAGHLQEREQNKRLLAFAVTGLSRTVNQMERDLYYNAGNKKRERKKVNDQKEPKPQVHNRNENIAYTSREVNTSGAIPTKKKIIKFTTSLLQATNMYYINCFTVRNESRIVPEALLTAASWMRRGDYREPCNHHHHHLARLHSEITKNKLWF